MRYLLLIAALGLLFAGGPWARENSPSHSDSQKVNFSIKDLPPSSACETGCTLQHHELPRLSKEKFIELRQKLHGSSLSSDNPHLEKLIYFGEETLNYLDQLGPGSLSKKEVLFLRRQLSRKKAYVSLKVTDRRGVLRLRAHRTPVPLGKKKHFHIEERHNIQSPELSGTIYRVGLDHIWIRY